MSLVISDDTALLERTANLPTCPAATLALWMKPTATRTVYHNPLEFAYDHATASQTAYIQMLANNTEWRTGYWSQGASPDPYDAFSSVYTLNQWIYLALVVSGTGGAIDITGYWLNSAGQLVDSAFVETADAAFTPTTVVIATTRTYNQPADTVFVPCKVAYGRMWDAALTLDELKAEQFSGTVVRSASINTAFGSFSTEDVSGNGRHWTSANLALDYDDDPPIAVPWAGAPGVQRRGRIGMGP